MQEIEQEFKALLKQFNEDETLAKTLAAVQYRDLFTEEFMVAHSKLKSLDELIFTGGFGIMSLSEVEKIPQETWNAYIAKYTVCQEWYSFGKLAMVKWMKSKLENPEQQEQEA